MRWNHVAMETAGHGEHCLSSEGQGFLWRFDRCEPGVDQGTVFDHPPVLPVSNASAKSPVEMA